MAKSKNKRKQPAAPAAREQRKEPGARAGSYDSQTPIWSFAIVDQDGPWSFAGLGGDELAALLRRMEGSTWATHGSHKSHNVTIDQLIPEARSRLEALGFDDLDELYSLRVNGKPRIWGIRDERFLKVLWWDPDHAVCPSEKKHT